MTPGYLSTTPRVVKEAGALAQAGYDVRVVCSHGDLEMLRQHDEALMRRVPWRVAVVRWSPARPAERRRAHLTRLRHHVAQRLPRFCWAFGETAAHAEGRIYHELAVLAALERADLYIGHYPAGLAAAARAAGRWQTQYAYDIEDLHTGEQPATPGGRRRAARIDWLERRYLPQCAYTTACAPLVAEAIAARYHVPAPLPIHNVFPWNDRGRLDGLVKDRAGTALSLYWFSQVIGPGRGLEEAIRAVGQFPAGNVQLHLRGAVSESQARALHALARTCGAEGALRLHPPVAPDELLSRAAEHDIGLALEDGARRSFALTVTNKLFLYWLAGLAVIATDVPGQRAVMRAGGEPGALYPFGDHHALAGVLRRFLDDPEALRRCREAALAAARTRWNWEQESRHLVARVAAVVPLA